jgi:hypothetical protein
MPAACFSAPMTIDMVKRGLGGAVLLLLAAFGSAQNAEKLRNHFDSDGLLREPAFFDFLVLGPPGEAEWKVVGGYNPPSAPNHVSQVMPYRPADSIAAAIRRNSTFRDGTWSVAMRQGNGRGGIVFRMTGEGDFLVLLVDLATGETRLSSYRNGRSTDLARGAVKGRDRDEWNVLKVIAAGPRISAQWQGKALLEATDPNPAAGRSAMAAAGPGVVSFDEFILDPAPEAGR